MSGFPDNVCCTKCYEASAPSKELNEAEHFRHKMNTPFIMCSKCGNKRCPMATDHELPCTGSNEPGQAGSRYE